jgi:hypothetical protein
MTFVKVGGVLVNDKGLPLTAVSKPTTIFKRSDTPFEGGGTEVTLQAEPGYTKSGFLGVPFRFQVPPLDNIQKTRGHNWQGYMVTGGADGPKERSRSEGPKLQTVTFKAIVLNWEPSWQVWSPDELEPQLAAAELEELVKRGIKFRLRIRNAELYDYDDVNMLAAMTQADVTEEAGEPDARYIQCGFQEWDPTEVERKALKNTIGPWSHKVVAGDSLYTLSQHYYKTNTLWKLIAAANHLTSYPPSQPLFVGNVKSHKVLKIPAKPASASTISANGERQTTAIVLP